MISNETDLHYKVVNLIRRYYPDTILVAGLGEKQDTEDKYLLLAEFSVRTVNYGPSFFPGHNIDGKKRGSVIYITDRKNEANKMFIIWLLPV